MPDRSRISPMKVKNGMASRVSFSMIPNSRLGSAWSSEGGSMPSSMPTNANSSPLAASAKAIGNPDSRNTTRLANMIGAMFAARKCVIVATSYCFSDRPVDAACAMAAISSAGSVACLRNAENGSRPFR
ncbi:hypothetical protein D3C87_1432320 [compost metagenome]